MNILSAIRFNVWCSPANNAENFVEISFYNGDDLLASVDTSRFVEEEWTPVNLRFDDVEIESFDNLKHVYKWVGKPKEIKIWGLTGFVKNFED